MTAKDKIHDAVKNALIKDGWTITDDPLTLEYEDAQVFTDLGAERVIGAERNHEKIAVEIKSFIGRSVMQDMAKALGQYGLYHSFLKIVEPDRKLYLAISHVTYDEAFQRKSVQWLIKDHELSFIVVNIVTEEVSQWIAN